jgi:hypothetical protein
VPRTIDPERRHWVSFFDLRRIAWWRLLGPNGAQEQEAAKRNGNRVLVEFVGVRDLMHLGPECDAVTVWYEIRTMRRPLERRRQLIPQPAKLSAIRLEKDARRSHRQDDGRT